MVVTALLLSLVAVATYTDLRRHKVYNWTTYPGILGALSIDAVGELLLTAAGADERWLRRLGWLPLLEGLAGLGICGLLMVLCYVMFGRRGDIKTGIRGGDVKLIAMIGAFLGPYDGLEAMLWTFVLGGCMGLIVLIWRRGPGQVVGLLFRLLLQSLRFGRWAPLSEADRAALNTSLFLAPSALTAVIVVRFGIGEMLM